MTRHGKASIEMRCTGFIGRDLSVIQWHGELCGFDRRGDRAVGTTLPGDLLQTRIGGHLSRPLGLTLRSDITFTKLIAKPSNFERCDQMPAVTIRNLSEETHRALKVRAAHHGRSAEAEMRDILEAAVRPANRIRIGSALSALSRDAGLTNADFEALEQTRDQTPAKPMGFE
ncbi:hypothetical protein NYR55_03925 [Sphingomonas sp. BGYR3]|uniref:FitA-like ribbon-helix-helix domain-containing protein n=1 Tax=Sphingomonas sp. BGYR3 TaxID=2975483 RepID=UPI0021A5AF8D|nr:hypothetical protein [Sphingomonas sp. BGYR3]MDG5487773.1 hypothetical protein [Sphingomonas sp. BGYR3]